MAIEWGERYLQENNESKTFEYKKGEVINDDLKFVSVQVERIKERKGVELHAAYARLRAFKHFYEAFIK